MPSATPTSRPPTRPPSITDRRGPVAADPIVAARPPQPSRSPRRSLEHAPTGSQTPIGPAQSSTTPRIASSPRRRQRVSYSGRCPITSCPRTRSRLSACPRAIFCHVRAPEQPGEFVNLLLSVAYILFLGAPLGDTEYVIFCHILHRERVRYVIFARIPPLIRTILSAVLADPYAQFAPQPGAAVFSVALHPRQKIT